MMHFLFRYSGLLTIVIAWILLVLPYLLLKKKQYRVSWISNIVLLGSPYSWIIAVGVISASITQIAFALYILSKFPSFWGSIAAAVFSLGAFCFLLSGTIAETSSVKVHGFFIKTYILLMTTGALLFMISFILIKLPMAIIVTTPVIVWIIGAVYFYSRDKWDVTELWIIFFSSVWVVMLYLFIL